MTDKKIVEVPKEVVDETMEVSYTKAKKLLKEAKRREKGAYVMSEAQKKNVARLVEANKKRKEERDRLKEKTVNTKVEEAKEVVEQKKEKTIKMVVKPKTIKKKPKPIIIEQSETEDDEEEDDEPQPQVIIMKKKKNPPPKKPVSPKEEKVKKQVELVQQIDNVLQRRNDPYDGVRNQLRNMFRIA